MKATSPRVTFQQKPPASVAWSVQNSPAGKLVIGVAPDGKLCRVSFAQSGKTEAILREWQKEWPKTSFKKAARETESAAKKIAKNHLPDLLLAGTPFQHKVWKGLLGLAPGETVSYGALARRIKNPKAARAVGGACGKNPVVLFVPCHRVIANDGGLGGFSSGLGIKRALLKAEAKK